MKSVNMNQIGDGKLPNKYWVTIHEDYHIMIERGTLDWMSSYLKDFKPKGKTLPPVTTYKHARKIANEYYLGIEEDGIVVNTVSIEDRLSGQLYERSQVFNPKGTKKMHEHEEFEDTRFTKEKMKEKGYIFE
ncbi:MAG: hypothetical protein NUV47_02470 [Patescibacteria group bacterium]|nr:hypothetical protein [Patescibacteria group bacterium]